MRSITKWTLLCASAFAGSAAATGWANAKSGTSSPYAALGQLARVLVIVENEYVEPVERARLVDGAITGMVAELDPHSAYMPPAEYGMFQDDSEGRFGGVGVEVDFSDEVITIIAPIEGSPADRAGILPGDRIVAIDDEPVRGRSSAELVRAMRGKAGTRVKLTVRRDGTEKPLHFTLEREVIEVASVRAELLKDDVLYLRVKQFQHGTHRELLENVARLRAVATSGRFRGVLMDLRNNPGGLVDEAVAVADELLPGGVVFTSRRRNEVVDEARARSGGALRKEPTVVLVNEFSASAAELVAGALQDHRRATVVGAPTFGKGSVQTILDLPGGAGLKLTTMRYYTPKGRAIQAQGIQPDVLVDASVSREKSFGVLRESDLENHLPAEGPPGSASPDGPPRAPRSPDGGAPPTHLGVAREVPHDPTGSADFALAIGYQIVRGVLRR